MKKLKKKLVFGAVTAAAAAALSLAACSNRNEAVYGPPEDMGTTVTPAGEEEQDPEEIREDFEVESNQNEEVYGPPQP